MGNLDGGGGASAVAGSKSRPGAMPASTFLRASILPLASRNTGDSGISSTTPRKATAAMAQSSLKMKCQPRVSITALVSLPHRAMPADQAVASSTTRRVRRRPGRNSAVPEIMVGMAPPSARPEPRRTMAASCGLCTAIMARDRTPNTPTQAAATILRPNTSAMGAITREPIIRPKILAENTSARAPLVMCHSLIRPGAT